MGFTTAVAQETGAVETAAEFLKRLAVEATETGLKEVLVGAPDREPDEEDRVLP